MRWNTSNFPDTARGLEGIKHPRNIPFAFKQNDSRDLCSEGLLYIHKQIFKKEKEKRNPPDLITSPPDNLCSLALNSSKCPFSISSSLSEFLHKQIKEETWEPSIDLPFLLHWTLSTNIPFSPRQNAFNDHIQMGYEEIKMSLWDLLTNPQGSWTSYQN